MDQKTINRHKAEQEESKKLQDALDKKTKAEVETLLAEAKKEKIYISASTTNPEAIKKVIEAAKAAKANIVLKDGDTIS